MIRAVCIDFGGVIVRTEDRQPRREAAEQAGMSVRELEALIFESASSERASRGEIPEQEHWAWINQALGLPKEAADQITARFFAGDRRDDLLLDFLRTLRPGCKVCLISNAWSGLRAMIAGQGFADVFDEMIISSEVGLVKPEAAIYQLALQRLGVEPQEAVFLDDMPANIEAARKLGLQTIHFVPAQEPLEELKRLLDHHR